MRRLHGFGIAFLVGACVAAPSATPATSTAPTPTPTPPIATVTPMPATPAPTHEPTASPPPAVGWQLVADIDAFDGLQLDAVVWTGARFLASSQADGIVILESSDGLAWRRRPPISGRGDVLRTITAGTQGVVAVGWRRTWRSPDGLSWTRGTAIAKEPLPEERELTLADVVETDDGWLAVGAEMPFCPVGCGHEGWIAATWQSDDGLTWTRDPPSPVMRDAEMRAVARTDEGFVAVGSAAEHREQRAAVWRSADGRSWERAEDSDVFTAPPEAVQGWVGMTDVVAVSGRLVAIGQAFSQDFGGSALAWYSDDDGRTWRRAAGDRFLNGQIFATSVIPGGFVATGPSGRLSCRGGIWLSSDGTAWSCVAADSSFRGFAAYAGAASSTTLVVVGFGGGEHRFEASAWVHDLASLEELR